MNLTLLLSAWPHPYHLASPKVHIPPPEYIVVQYSQTLGCLGG